MWSMYVYTTDINSYNSFYILDFKANAELTEANFNNSSYTRLSYPIANDNTLDKYINPAQSSYMKNYIANNRYNIAHITYGADGSMTPSYDGCGWEWIYHDLGSGIYYFDAYRTGSLTYSNAPKWVSGASDIPKNRVQSMTLIATSLADGKIGTVRPLYRAIDDAGQVGYVLGAVIPSSTISEWLKSSKEEPDDPDEPYKPDPNPADEADATSPNYTWLNKFKIMKYTGTVPNHLIIDYEWATSSFLTDILPYYIYNDDNDASYKYHTALSYIGTSDAAYALNESARAAMQHLNDDIATLGSSLTHVINVDNSSGYFTTANNLIDADIWSNGSLQYMKNININQISIGNLTIDNTNAGANDIYGNDFNGWSIPDDYPSDQGYWGAAPDKDYGEALYQSPSFADLMIIQTGSGYYLGGPFCVSSSSYGRWGFAFYCKLPQDIADALDDEFGGWENNPNTDDLIDSDDPVNENTDYNEHDGSMDNGTGNITEGDTEIPDPSSELPSEGGDGTFSGAGSLAIFTPTRAELSAFMTELNGNSALNVIKDFFNTNPMDGIYGLHMLPFTGFAGATTAIPRIGTYDFTDPVTLCAVENLTVNYGTVYVPFIYDGYENYAPDSDVKLYLPFIGTKDIDINIVQGCNCTLKYIVSVVTGDIYAYMYCQWAAEPGSAGSGVGVDHLVYSWQGNCAAQIPLSHLDSSNYISGAMQAAAGISSLVTGAVSGNPASIVSGATSSLTGVSTMTKPSMITSGNISGYAGYIGTKTPYFIFSRPIVPFNSTYNHYLGRVSNTIMSVGALRKGTYTELENIDLTGVPATKEEISEMRSILEGGFYI